MIGHQDSKMASGFGMLGIPGGELDIFVEFDKTFTKAWNYQRETMPRSLKIKPDY